MYPDINPGLIISGETIEEVDVRFDPKNPLLSGEIDIVYRASNDGSGTNRYVLKKRIKSFTCHRCNQTKDMRSLGIRHLNGKKKEILETRGDGTNVKTISDEEEMYCKWCSALLLVTAPLRDIKNGGNGNHEISNA